jgi:mannose-1-phosphate guanylyltransferase
MRAVVLAGGFGTRLRPLTATRPTRHGVDDVVLSMGYRPDAIVEAYPDGRCAGVRVTYAVEPEPLDTAGAIRFAATQAGIDERFLVMNGDVLTDLDLGAFVAFHAGHGAEATIHLHPVDDPSRFGVVPTDAEGRVLAFVEKPAPGEAPTNLINAGTYVLEPSVLDRIPAGRRVSIERETFPDLVAAGALYACDGSSYWIDVGTPQQYLEAQMDLLDGTFGPGVDGVDPGAKVDRTAIVARAVLGAGSVVEAGARVERSVLLAGARVEAGAEVRDSVLGAGTVVAEGAAVVGGTIVGDGEIVEQGTRLDGARVPVPS